MGGDEVVVVVVVATTSILVTIFGYAHTCSLKGKQGSGSHDLHVFNELIPFLLPLTLFPSFPHLILPTCFISSISSCT